MSDGASGASGTPRFNEMAYLLAKYAVIGLSLVIFSFPIYWMFLSSVQPTRVIVTYPPTLVPTEFTLENLTSLLTGSDYLVWLKNSIIVSLGDVVLSTTLATLAGYALTRYRIPMKKWLARAFIFGYMFPVLTLGVPYFIIFRQVGLIDTLPGLILAHTAIALPFSTWIMWQFFQTVPISTEEAAWVCGASRTRAMFEVAIPAAFPGIMATAIFAFAVGWNDFTFALMLISSPEKQPLTLGIQTFLQSQQIFWGDLMAASAGLVIPPLILVLLLNKYILAGFTIRAN